MGTTRVLIAKYVPDVFRMEPRNIGVVVWRDGQICSRFLGVDSAGHVDPPAFAKSDRHAYREWLDSWKMQFEKTSLHRRDNGRIVPRESPEFVDVLRSQSKLQFMLTDAATLNGDVKAADLPTVTEEFFSRLVETESNAAENTADVELKHAWREIFSSRRLADPILQRPKQNHLGKVFGVCKYFDVHQALGVSDDKTTVFLRVIPGHGNSANLAALTFRALGDMDTGPIRYGCVSMYFPSQSDNGAAKDLEILGYVSRLINVADRKRAILEAEDAVGLNGQPA